MCNACGNSTVVEMTPEAVSARLRAVARMLDERGFADKGIDMSPTAITGRLRSMAALSDMCRRLGRSTLAERVTR